MICWFGGSRVGCIALAPRIQKNGLLRLPCKSCSLTNKLFLPFLENLKGTALDKEQVTIQESPVTSILSSIEMPIQLENLMVAIRIQEPQRLAIKYRICFMNYGMMIRAYYHQVVIIVVHRAHKLDNMVDLDNPLIVRLSEICVADLAPKVIKRLNLRQSKIKPTDLCQLYKTWCCV